jgi:hypothetical protein
MNNLPVLAIGLMLATGIPLIAQEMRGNQFGSRGTLNSLAGGERPRMMPPLLTLTIVLMAATGPTPPQPAAEAHASCDLGADDVVQLGD